MRLSARPIALAIILSLLLTGCRSSTPVLDRYGQNDDVQWWGKIHRDEDVKKRLSEESASLKPAGNVDRYGGTLDGPLLEATGHFRTEKYRGRWWLVTPEGHLFYSLGVTLVRSKHHATIITGRESRFRELPAEGSPGATFYSPHPYDPAIRIFNFYQANIERWYQTPDGPPAQEIWRDRTLRRLVDWGFNTIGNWSEYEICDLHRLPYTQGLSLFEQTRGKRGEIDFVGVPTFVSGKQVLADVFSPQYRKHLLALTSEGDFADEHTHLYDADPWCLGIFVDNEIPWSAGEPAERHALARAVLAHPGRSYAKDAFWKTLARRYADISGLNAAWDTSFSAPRLEDLALEVVTLPGQANDVLRRDLEELTGFFAERYFSTVKKAFRRHLPNKLYLGSRFDAHTPKAVIAASAKFVDVVSLNIYERVLATAPHLPVLFDKPLLVSEFHFGARDRGAPRGGVITVRNQTKRAAAYVKFVNSVLENPAFVGFHWFQYADEPVTGRYGDGEDFNCGLVSVMDLPHRELTQAATALNRSVYHRLLTEAE